jgi:hypothetical protein
VPSAKDLVFKLRSLTGEFRTDDAARELDELEQSLKATGDQARISAREVRQAADDLDAPGFDRAAAEAEATATRMRAAAEDMASGVRTGAQKIDTETDKIRTDMGDAGKEVGAEFVGNIAEGIGSGSANVTDVVQGTLGGITNLAASLTGPVGIAAAGAAAGIGLVFSAVKGQAEAAKEKLDSLRGALEDVADLSSKAARDAIFKQWLEETRQIPGQLDKIASAVRQAGVDGETFQAALAGSAEAQETIRQKLQAAGIEIIKNRRETGGITAEQEAYLENMALVLKDLGIYNQNVTAIKGEHEDIAYLSGKAKENTAGSNRELDDGIAKAKELGRTLDYTFRDRTLQTTVVVRDQTGRNIRLPDPRLA